MSTETILKIRLLAKEVWLKQISLLLIIIIVVAYFDRLYAKSILIGGLIFILPSIYFALVTFRSSDTKSVKLLLHNIYRGEFGKFLLTTTCFAIAFVLLKPFNVVVLFSTFFIMTIINSIMLGCRKLF